MDIAAKEAWRSSRVRSVPQAQDSPHRSTVVVEGDASHLEKRISELERRKPPAPAVTATPDPRVAELEAQLAALTVALADAAADRAQLMNICKALDDRISSFGVKVEKAA